MKLLRWSFIIIPFCILYILTLVLCILALTLYYISASLKNIGRFLLKIADSIEKRIEKIVEWI